MAERTLTQRDLNRALLARQLLLERSTLPIPRVLERIGGIQNQYAPNAYIRLWSCLEAFQRDDLTRALERRSVVQGTLMRTTIHTVSARDYWLFAMGTRQARREWWLRLQKGSVTTRTMERRAARVRAAFRDRQLTAQELEKVAPGYVDLWLDLVRVPPSGTWERRRANVLAVAEAWLGPSQVAEEAGLEHLVRRYLGGFGPASVNDIASWAGLPAATAGAAVERLRLRRFRDEEGRELLDLPRAPLPDRETSAPVRFLPTWDATLLVHARRTGILPEKFRPLIFSTKIPPSVPTFLVDGAVAGTWKYENGRVNLAPFAPLGRSVQRELREESERLAAFHG